MSIPGAFCATAAVLAVMALGIALSTVEEPRHIVRPRAAVASALACISVALLIVAAWWAALA